MQEAGIREYCVAQGCLASGVDVQESSTIVTTGLRVQAGGHGWVCGSLIDLDTGCTIL